MKDFITIIIPAKYEEKTILKTLQEIKKNVKVPHKTIVVNDGDLNDRTSEIVKKYASHDRSVKLIIQEKNIVKSFSSALLCGVKHCKSGFVVLVMADMCDRVKDINVMYKKMLNGWDIVCASRYMKGGKKSGGPFVQSMLSRIVCETLHIITNIPTCDVSNAFKMYRVSIFDTININPLIGVEVSMDITLQSYFHGAKITEIPTVWKGRKYGKSKFNFSKRAPRYLRIYLYSLKQTLIMRLGFFQSF